MADIVDLVQQVDANELAKNRVQVKEQHVNFNGKDCVDCGDPLPAKRLELLNTVRCSECIVYHNRSQLNKKYKEQVE